MELVVACLLAIVCSLIFTPLIRSLAERRGLVAMPSVDRWHKRRTAMMGGVAIYLAFLTGILAFSSSLPDGANLVLAGATVLFVVGFVDDLIGIGPPVKLALQLIVAAIVVYFGKKLPWTDSNVLNTFITIFWLVGITNAVNLLDNMDGLAAGIVVIGCAFLALTFVLNGQMTEALLPLILGGAALGFLYFNFTPASIFMGDCGSLFLGFSLGGMALLSNYDRTRNVGTVLMTPVLIMLIPIFDTMVVTISRKFAGRPISQGGRDHTSHRLVQLGITERRAVQLLFALSIAAGTLAIMVRQMQIQVMVVVLAAFILSLVSLGVYLSKVRVYELAPAPPNGAILRAMVGFAYKRRLFETVLDVILIALALSKCFPASVRR
jgi:UDP-GlcNAc:undecaprenyl-phosphate GlcNAc-1-phosphate transferase